MLKSNESYLSVNSLLRIKRLAGSKLISHRAEAGEAIMKNADLKDQLIKGGFLTERKISKLTSETIWYRATRRRHKQPSRWMQSVIDMKKDGIIK